MSQSAPERRSSPQADRRRLLVSIRRRPVLSAVLIAVCLSLVGAIVWFVVAPQVAAQASWRKAQQALADYDFRAAREHFRACLEAWPRSAETHFQLARAARRAGDFETARVHLKHAEDLGWLHDQVDLELLLIPAQQGEFAPGAEDTLRMYLDTRKYPEEDLIFEALAKGYLHSYRLFDARALLEDWQKARPNDWQAHYWHGSVLERMGKAEFEKSKADYERVLQLRPHDAETHLMLARVILRGGQDYAAAARYFSTYLEKKPGHAEARVGLARCQRALGRTDEARQTLEQVVEEHPEHLQGLVALAMLEADLEHAAKALELLRRAEKLGPNELDVVHQLGLVLRRLGNATAAETYERRYAELEASLRALDRATKAAAMSPTDADARQEAGAILLKVGKEQDGLRWLREALRADPRHKPSHRTLADFYEKSPEPNAKQLAEYHRQRAQ